MAGDDEGVRLPLVLGPVSNGEFLPLAARPGDVRLARAVLDRAAVAADALAMDRRLFLRTAGGMAALLATINLAACSSHSRTSASASGRPATPGGSYRTPPPEQLPECRAALGSKGEFIVDVHTHHVMPSLPWRTTAPATLRLVLDMVPPDCAAANPLTCVDRAAYLHDMFLASDTTVALLSDLPSTGESNDPLPFSAADDTWQLASSLTRGGQSRLLLQNVVAPNFGSLAERLDGMTATAQTRRVSAFKVYTAWGPGGRGFDLDDPAVGLPVVQHAQDLGVTVLCAHKGLPLLDFESTWNQPRDMVAVSRQFPGMQFVVYHAGWTPQHIEGPYNPADPVGVDSLLWALDRYHVPPNSNVWADLATVWRGAAGIPADPALIAASGVFLAGWYGWRRTRSRAFRGRQISKPLARARRTGSFAYGVVLGTGILTIVSTPAVWLGLACCLAAGSTAWGAVYGASFGTGRALVLLHDVRRSRAAPPGAVPMLVLARRLDPRSRLWLYGVAGGLALTGLTVAAYA